MRGRDISQRKNTMEEETEFNYAEILHAIELVVARSLVVIPTIRDGLPM